MKKELIFNPLPEGGKRYNFIIVGSYTKREIKVALKKILKIDVHVTSLNRGNKKRYYITFPEKKEIILRNYINQLEKVLIKPTFNPLEIEKINRTFLDNK